MRHEAESGTDGELPYGPYGRQGWPPQAELRERTLLRWQTPLDGLGWRRAWGLWHGAAVVGSVHLAGGELETCLHRAVLGVGLERAYRGAGQGRRLMEAAIAWAEDEPRLDWIDLGVFEGNDRALALYLQLGFVERGRAVDQFRVDGVHITDIQMSLAVGARGTIRPD